MGAEAFWLIPPVRGGCPVCGGDHLASVETHPEKWLEAGITPETNPEIWAGTGQDRAGSENGEQG